MCVRACACACVCGQKRRPAPARAAAVTEENLFASVEPASRALDANLRPSSRPPAATTKLLRLLLVSVSFHGPSTRICAPPPAQTPAKETHARTRARTRTRTHARTHTRARKAHRICRPRAPGARHNRRADAPLSARGSRRSPLPNFNKFKGCEHIAEKTPKVESAVGCCNSRLI